MNSNLADVTVMESFRVTLDPADASVTIQEVTFDDHSKIVTIPAETWLIIVREVARAKRELAHGANRKGANHEC